MKILEAQQHGDLVASGRGDQVVESLEVDCRQLVDDDARFELAFLIYELDNPGIIQSQSRSVNVLPVGIVPHAEYLGIVRVIDVEREVIARHDPI